MERRLSKEVVVKISYEIRKGFETQLKGPCLKEATASKDFESKDSRTCETGSKRHSCHPELQLNFEHMRKIKINHSKACKIMGCRICFLESLSFRSKIHKKIKICK
jgi:hypothetical protein